MGEQQPIVFPQIGGIATVSYELDCISEVGFYNWPNGDWPGKEWLTITESHDDVGDIRTGFFTIQAGATRDEHSQIELFFTVNGGKCETSIKISQEGIACSCENIPKEYIIINEGKQLSNAGVAAGTHIGKYKILDNCDYTAITATCEDTEEPKHTYSISFAAPNSEGIGDIVLDTAIPEVPEEHFSPIEYRLSISYNNQPCYDSPVIFYQEGKVSCSCRSITYFIRQGSITAFPIGGTGYEDTQVSPKIPNYVIIGEGDTAVRNGNKEIINVCGQVLGVSSDDILQPIDDRHHEDNDITYVDPDPSAKVNKVITTFEPLTPEEAANPDVFKGPYHFYFKAAVIPGQQQVTDAAGLNYVFVKYPETDMEEETSENCGTWSYVYRSPDGCNCDSKPNLTFTYHDEDSGRKIPTSGLSYGTEHKIENGLFASIEGNLGMRFKAEYIPNPDLDPSHYLKNLEIIEGKRWFDTSVPWGGYNVYSLKLYGEVIENDKAEDLVLGKIKINYYCTTGKEGESYDRFCGENEFDVIQAKKLACSCDYITETLSLRNDYTTDRKYENIYFNWCKDNTIGNVRVTYKIKVFNCFVFTVENEYGDLIEINEENPYIGDWYKLYPKLQLDDISSAEREWFYYFYAELADEYERTKQEDKIIVHVGYYDSDNVFQECLDFDLFVVDNGKCNCDAYNDMPNHYFSNRRDNVIELTGKTPHCEGTCRTFTSDAIGYCYDGERLKYVGCVKYYILGSDGTIYTKGQKYSYKKDGNILFEAYVDTTTSSNYEEWEFCVSNKAGGDASYTEHVNVFGYVDVDETTGEPIACDNTGIDVTVYKTPCFANCNCSLFFSDKVYWGNDIDSFNWHKKESGGEKWFEATYIQTTDSWKTMIQFVHVSDYAPTCNYGKLTLIKQDENYPEGYVTDYTQGAKQGEFSVTVSSTIEKGTRTTEFYLEWVDVNGNPIEENCKRRVVLIEKFEDYCSNHLCGEYNINLQMNVEPVYNEQGNVKYGIGKNVGDEVENMFSILEPSHCFSAEVVSSNEEYFTVEKGTPYEESGYVRIPYTVKTLTDLSGISQKDFAITIRNIKLDDDGRFDSECLVNTINITTDY